MLKQVLSGYKIFKEVKNKLKNKNNKIKLVPVPLPIPNYRIDLKVSKNQRVYPLVNKTPLRN